jgi:hypothetical protein
MSLVDAHDIGNALGGGPTDPATASFDVRWLGGGDRESVHDSDVGFVFKSVEGDAHIDWTATNLATGFSFTSSPSEQTTAFAAVGKEQNGIFFH